MRKKIFEIVITFLCCGLFLYTENLIFIWSSIGINSILLFRNLLKKKNDYLKTYLWMMFITYLVSLFYFIALSSVYHRSFVLGDVYFKALPDYLKDSSNFIPFKTIYGYMGSFFTFTDEVRQNVIVLNLLGNFCCLMPLAVFIPALFKKFSSVKRYSLVILGVTCFIELFQLLTLTGSVDIDDIILNFSGSILVYILFNKEICNFFYNKFKIVNSKKELKIFIIKVLFSILLFGITIGLFIIRKVKEDEWWNDYYNMSFTLVSYDNVCKTKGERLIYDDGVIGYYSTCSEIDELFIDINGNQYKIMDYFEGKTKYYVNLATLIELEKIGFEIITKGKYEQFEVCYQYKDYLTYKTSDSSILELVYITEYSKDGNNCKSFYLVPGDDGLAKATFGFQSGRYKDIVYMFEIKGNKVTLVD